MNKFKPGFAQRTTAYGILASIACLVFAAIMGSSFFGVIGLISLFIHLRSI